LFIFITCKPPKDPFMEIKRLFDFLAYQLENAPLDVAIATKKNGKWEKYSTADFYDLVQQTSRGLLKLGVSKEDKIAISAHENRTEWNAIDLATLQLGGIDVPIYPTIAPEDFEYIFNHAEVKYAFVGDEELYNKVMSIKDKVPTLKEVFTFNEVKGARNWSEILEMGKDESLQEEVEKRKAEVKPEQLATLIYTSGTTGRPKGVMLSHNNVVKTVISASKRIPPLPKPTRVISFLPTCHIFERVLHYLYYYNSFQIYNAESIDKIGDNIREVKPHLFTAVPRLLEKVYDKIINKGMELSGIKKALFFWAVKVGEEFDFDKAKQFPYSLKLKLARKLIFSKWKEALGGEIRYIISGAAALHPRIQRVFIAGEINVLEGYGMTESSGVISVNSPNAKWKIGTVGLPIDVNEVKIAEDGEILARGENVMMGYYKDPEKTADTIKDGWLHTGDIGELDEDGMLRITDRKKEIFKTSGGKYIAPQAIENAMKQSPFIEQIMVIGEGQKMPAAFIQPAFDFIREWAKRHGMDFDGLSEEEIAAHPKVYARIEEEVSKINKQFGKWEQVKKFELTGEVWSIDLGHLTPTMKLKRRNILKRYAHLFDKIYNEE